MKVINIIVDGIMTVDNIYDTDNQTTIGMNTGLKIPTGNFQSILCTFDFRSPSPYQEGLQLFAIFKNKLKSIEVQITDIEAEGKTYINSCFIPAEILEITGGASIGIYGYILDGENLVKRLSLCPLNFNVVLGSYDEEAIEESVPTPTVFEVYFEEVRKANELLEEKMMLYKKEEATYTANIGDTEFAVNFEDFSNLFNLLVYKNSLALIENTDYTIDYTNKKIVLTQAIETDGTEIHIIGFVSMVVNIDDFDIIRNGAELNNAVQELQEQNTKQSEEILELQEENTKQSEEIERLKADIEAISMTGMDER